MKSFSSKWAVGVSVAALFVSGACLAATTPDSPEIPKSWIDLSSDREQVEERSSRVDKAIQAILDAQAAAFDSPELESVIAPSGNDPLPNAAPWGLKRIQTSLAVSSEGFLGALFSSGRASAQIVWSAEGKKALDGYGSSDLSISSEQELSRALVNPKPSVDALVDRAIAAGKIKDKERLRKGIASSFSDFLAIASTLERRGAGNGFRASRFRLEVAFSASGWIVAPTEVGVVLTLRLDWRRGQASSGAKPTGSAGPLAARFEELLDGTLAVLPELRKESSNFGDSGRARLASVRIGLGIGAEKQVGWAPIGAGATGSVTFESAGQELSVEELKTGSQLALFTASSAKSKQISLSRMKKGLARGAKLAKALVQACARPMKSRWKPVEVDVELDLSVSGNAGLTTLSGSTVLELDYELGGS